MAGFPAHQTGSMLAPGVQAGKIPVCADRHTRQYDWNSLPHFVSSAALTLPLPTHGYQ